MLYREIVAFANSSGGRIFLGISDNKEIKGVDLTNKLKSQIQDIANNCHPAVKIIFDAYKNILIVTVREGDDKPFKCSSGFYTRVGPNFQKLNRNEIIEFIKAEGKLRFDELINLKFDYDAHFDQRKLEKFLRLSGISKVLDNPSILTNLGVAEKQEGKVIFNNTGILFFSRNLADIYYHTAVTCALYKGAEKVDVLDRRDFNEDIISNIDGAMNFLKQYIPVRYEMTGTLKRKEIPEVPYDALRKAVINAIAHRDYFEKGANVMIEMFDDRIEITNPGGLVKGLRPEDFGRKSVLRNPNIANLLHRIEYIEKMGTGISKIRRIIKSAGLPNVKFEFNIFFTVTFTRPMARKEMATLQSEAEKFGIKFGIKGNRLQRMIGIIDTLKREEAFSVADFAVKSGVTTRVIEKDMDFLKMQGVIEFHGARKTGRYVITGKGGKMIREIS